MAWKGRETGTDQFDYNRLLTILSEAKVKQNDNPLFQVVNTLIRGATNFKDALTEKLGKNDKLNANQINGKITIEQGGAINGMYVPFVTLIANCGVGVDDLYFTRIGDLVNVFGRFAVLPTLIGANTEFAFELPIISYFKFSYQCAGSGYSDTENQGAAILGDVGNNRARMKFISVNNIQMDIYFTFGYKLIAK